MSVAIRPTPSIPPHGCPINLVFSAKNLADRDILTHSDPFLILYQYIPELGTFQRIAQTEVIESTLNPHWETMLQVYFYPPPQLTQPLQHFPLPINIDTLKHEHNIHNNSTLPTTSIHTVSTSTLHQTSTSSLTATCIPNPTSYLDYKIEIWDCDDIDLIDLTKHDFLGTFHFNLATLLSTVDHTIDSKLYQLQQQSKYMNTGSIRIQAFPLTTPSQYAKCTCHLESTLINDDKSIYNTPSILQLQFLQIDMYNHPHIITTMNSIGNGEFPSVRINLEQLCGQDPMKQFIIRIVKNWHIPLKSIILSETYLTLTDIMTKYGQVPKWFQFQQGTVIKSAQTNPKFIPNNTTNMNDKSTAIATLIVKEFDLDYTFTIHDYIQQQLLDMNVTFAIDFSLPTLSTTNSSPTSKVSKLITERANIFQSPDSNSTLMVSKHTSIHPIKTNHNSTNIQNIQNIHNNDQFDHTNRDRTSSLSLSRPIQHHRQSISSLQGKTVFSKKQKDLFIGYEQNQDNSFIADKNQQEYLFDLDNQGVVINAMRLIGEILAPILQQQNPTHNTNSPTNTHRPNSNPDTNTNNTRDSSIPPLPPSPSSQSTTTTPTPTTTTSPPSKTTTILPTPIHTKGIKLIGLSGSNSAGSDIFPLSTALNQNPYDKTNPLNTTPQHLPLTTLQEQPSNISDDTHNNVQLANNPSQLHNINNMNNNNECYVHSIEEAVNIYQQICTTSSWLSINQGQEQPFTKFFHYINQTNNMSHTPIATARRGPIQLQHEQIQKLPKFQFEIIFIFTPLESILIQSKQERIDLLHQLTMTLSKPIMIFFILLDENNNPQCLDCINSNLIPIYSSHESISSSSSKNNNNNDNNTNNNSILPKSNSINIFPLYTIPNYPYTQSVHQQQNDNQSSSISPSSRRSSISCSSTTSTLSTQQQSYGLTQSTFISSTSNLTSQRLGKYSTQQQLDSMMNGMYINTNNNNNNNNYYYQHSSSTPTSSTSNLPSSTSNLPSSPSHYLNHPRISTTSSSPTNQSTLTPTISTGHTSNNNNIQIDPNIQLLPPRTRPRKRSSIVHPQQHILTPTLTPWDVYVQRYSGQIWSQLSEQILNSLAIYGIWPE